jgi:hypothetical protein
MLDKLHGLNSLVNMTLKKHIKGKKNQVVDALNKIAHEVHVAATNSDQHYLKIKETLQQGNF